MKQHSIPVFRNMKDLYASIGAVPDATLMTDDFSFCNLGDLAIPGAFISPAVYRTGFYSFLFVKDAAGKYLLNQYDADVVPGCICLGNPGDIIQFCFNEVKELYLLTVSESFLKENTHVCIMQEYPFLQAEAMPPMLPGADAFAEFESFYRQIEQAGNSASPLRKKQIAYLLLLILLKIKERCCHDYRPAATRGRQTDIVCNFRRMLQLHYQDLYNGDAERVFTVKEYADALGLHPNYLNDIIRKKTGRSISKWIIDKTIAESKYLLDHSSLSVKEVAYRLGFAEASYFCRYFKRYTQTTAAVYRSHSHHAQLLPGILHPVISTQSMTA
ncbi:helix-turn-helix domain-containing protein [Chitinophaga pinensis]|uniref:Helix-turn-helix transcriptional regulator n=1 Tax=Chitinophaga pinensis TaxID=79329 RepID=A0A5C6LTL0_9BACT|nr:helix-turn-helix transcriptional regulator [Chitinophaga pinensis]TWV99108.1 helix-turn-helix transcriptional regulator [Chitinophaga pinensis]